MICTNCPLYWAKRSHCRGFNSLATVQSSCGGCLRSCGGRNFLGHHAPAFGGGTCTAPGYPSQAQCDHTLRIEPERPRIRPSSKFSKSPSYSSPRFGGGRPRASRTTGLPFGSRARSSARYRMNSQNSALSRIGFSRSGDDIVPLSIPAAGQAARPQDRVGAPAPSVVASMPCVQKEKNHGLRDHVAVSDGHDGRSCCGGSGFPAQHRGEAVGSATRNASCSLRRSCDRLNRSLRQVKAKVMDLAMQYGVVFCCSKAQGRP